MKTMMWDNGVKIIRDMTPIEVAEWRSNLKGDARLEDWRSTALLSRAQFCIILKRVGLLTAAEAIVAAQGSVPAPMELALAALPTEAADEARILWAGLSQIERNHPLVALVGASVGLSDSAVDQLFGYEE